MALFGFIGAGNMGYPLLKAAIATFGTEQVIYTTNSMERNQFLMEDTGIKYTDNNKATALNCKYLVLAVKPQVYPEVLEEIKDVLKDNQIIISIAAGITIDTIKEMLGFSVRIVRAMPNTPALVGQGMTGISFSGDTFTEDEKIDIDKFFNSFGRYEVFDETLIDAVVCASGSSPAYVYMFIEALADSVVSYGMPRDKAYTMAAQAVLGAAAMVLETKEHPGALKDKVCSPGGTTIAAVKALEENGFRNAIIKATDANYAKSLELSKSK